jgi:purine-nucleoside phosphorylase
LIYKWISVYLFLAMAICVQNMFASKRGANMRAERVKAAAAAGFLKTKTDANPGVGLFTGTGLGESAAALEVFARVDYSKIPHFPVPTVQSHLGRLLFGSLGGKNVMVMQGRFHLYEGYSPREVTFPVRVMQELGVKVLIVTNAAGGLDPVFAAGDIMAITDHINLTGANPLVGPNEAHWGVRFPDMSAAYDPGLTMMARQSDPTIRQGVYAGLRGPSLETPAEIRFLRTIGAQAVGFSTVMEVIAAVHAKMRVMGLSIITNVCRADHPVPAAADDIIAVAEQSAPKLETVIKKVVQRIDVHGS